MTSANPGEQNRVTLCPANKLSFDPRPQMAALFAAGFSQWFDFFSKDPNKIAAAFQNAFQLDTFFVVITPDNQVLAMVGCPAGTPALELSRADFRRALGWYKGTLAYFILTKFLVDSHYPFPIEPGMGSIEFVVGNPIVQGKGFTRQLIEYVMRQRAFSTYVLEVASTNVRAVQLYESLGFTEKMRKPASKRSGVGSYLYLEHKMAGVLLTS